MATGKKDKRLHPSENEAQTSNPTKKEIKKTSGRKSLQPPIDTPATDRAKNSSKETPGLNQQETKANDLLPLD